MRVVLFPRQPTYRGTTISASRIFLPTFSLRKSTSARNLHHAAPTDLLGVVVEDLADGQDDTRRGQPEWEVSSSMLD